LKEEEVSEVQERVQELRDRGTEWLDGKLERLRVERRLHLLRQQVLCQQEMEVLIARYGDSPREWNEHVGWPVLQVTDEPSL
jgi:hypothetical protein